MPKSQKCEFHILYFKSDICDIFAKTIAFITIFHLIVLNIELILLILISDIYIMYSVSTKFPL